MDKDKLRRQNKLVVIILLILLCCALIIHRYFNYSLTPVNASSNQVVTVTIPRGATDHQVGRILKEKKVVRSAFVCDYYLQTHKTTGIKAGKFKLKASYSTPKIIKILQEPQASK